MTRLLKLFGCGFSPASLPGLALWLDAQDAGSILASGGRVSQWNDKSGRGNHATQATGSLQPLYVAAGMNGRASIQFRDDGTAKTLVVADNAAFDFATFSAFAVFQRITDMGTLETIFGKFDTGASQREWRLVAEGGGDTLNMYTSQTGSSTTVVTSEPTALFLGTAYIADGYYDGSNQKVSLNNNTPVSSAQAAVFNGTSVLAVGAINGGATQPFAGYIGELLFYNSVLSAAARQQVLKYLAAKWAVTIA